MTNAQNMSYIITGKQRDEWAAVLNLLGLSRLHAAGQSSSCSTVYVCVCVWSERLLNLTEEKSDSIKTSPEADTVSYFYGASVYLAKWTSFVVPRNVH